jgi:hypothetical protein
LNEKIFFTKQMGLDRTCWRRISLPQSTHRKSTGGENRLTKYAFHHRGPSFTGKKTKRATFATPQVMAAALVS